MDRRDDVAHLAGAGAAELGEQRIGHAARTGGGVGIVEVFLEHVAELAAAEHEPAPQMQAERIGERRPVERGGDRGPPVDDHRRARRLLDVAAPDVPAVAVLVVDPAEAERAGVVVERVEPPLQLPLHRLGVGLVGGQHVLVGDPGGRAPAHLLEAFLGEPQARALQRNVRVRHFGNAIGGEKRPAYFQVGIRPNGASRRDSSVLRPGGFFVR